MYKSDNKPYALLAGVCYAICGLRCILFATPNVIFWIAMIGMAVALFLKSEKVVIAAAVVNALHDLYWFIHYSTEYYYFYTQHTQQILGFTAYASVVALLLLTLKNNAIVKKIWFVSGMALLLGWVIQCNEWEYFLNAHVYWGEILFGLIEIGGLILIGLWAKEHYFSSSKAEIINEYSTFDPQTVYSSPLSDSVIGSADKLKMYKELLESGTITQEEFDDKKKQILGL